MGLAQRWHDIRTGFERPFWVANVSEIFERLSYYAIFAVLARYLHENLKFSTEQTGSLTGLFGFVWLLAAFGGTVADRLGFRRALSVAYLILSFAYFLLGSIGAPWLAPVRNAVPLAALVTVILLLPAFGIAMIKPCVVGTTERAAHPNVRTIGYSIYYTLVNIGGFCGPFVASWTRRHMSVENVFRVAALSVFLMFIMVLLLFQEPRRPDEVKTDSLGQAARNFWKVITNPRFMIFLLIFTGYWIVYWQVFITWPLFVHDYINPATDTERLLATGPIIVITLTVAISALTQKTAALNAVILGTFITGVAWIFLAVHPTVVTAVATLVVVALGELTMSPRYYEYCSRLAPSGQQGTYMGFAFVPLGIGSLIAGPFGGFLVHHFGEVKHQPQMIWWCVIAVGVATTLLLWIYDKTLRPKPTEEAQAATQ